MALTITDDRVAAAAARLHADGWRFSLRQLYYAVCADVEVVPARVAPGEVGLGVLLILVGLIVEQHVALIVLSGLGLALVVAGAVTHLQERRPPPVGRTLAVSYADFAERFGGPGRSWDGLLAAADDAGDSAPNGELATTLVVCDRAETAAVLAANQRHLAGVDVVVRGAEPEEPGERRVVTLHDCDPAGCALAAELRERGWEVADAGINPADLEGRRLQLLEGAPARLPRDLSAHLDPAQLDWLRSGRRLELATETPEQLVLRVRSAL